MPSRSTNETWIIIAFPAGLIVFLVIVLLVAIAVRPAKQTSLAGAAPSASVNENSQPQETPTPSPAPAPAESTPPTQTLVATSTPTGALGAVSSNPPAQVTPTVAAPTTRPAAVQVASANSANAIDLLAALNVEDGAVSGNWRKDGNVLHCTGASARSRAKLRLVPPPVGDGYDFSITFTPRGQKPFFAPVLSFHGRQFIFAMFATQSGFASIKGQNALANPTTVNKGIASGTKHTALVKVRSNEISAYLDGELATSYSTDYSDVDVSTAWNLGQASSRENFIGLASESPVTIESITLTPLQPQPASKPAPPAYKDLAVMISSSFSSESSAAATQPTATRGRVDADELQKIVAATQPVISDVAADLLRQMGVPGAATLPASTMQVRQSPVDRDTLYRAAQAALSPAPGATDPMLDVMPVTDSVTIDRTQFDAEQTRLAVWRAIMDHMSELYPNSQPQQNIVKLRIADATGDGQKGKPVSYFAAQSYSQPLTNVTLIVETVHALSSPSPTNVQCYYLPRWQPGQRIYLPAQCVPNVPSRELSANAGLPLPIGLAGIVEARAQLWSDQVSQPPQATSFDSHFQPIARAELDEAYRLLDEALRRPQSMSRPATASGQPAQGTAAPARRLALIPGPIVPVRSDLDENDPDLMRVRDLARRARALLPPQSSLADDARDLATQPQTALRDLRKRQVDAFIDALALRTTRQGVWVIHQPGLLSKMAKPSDREAAISAAGGAGGRVTLAIEARASDGTGVAVTLNSTEQPEVKRRFTGRLQVDASTPGRLILNLRATQPPPPKAPTPADLKRVVHWTSMLLELRGNALIGIATAGPGDEPTAILNIAFGPPVAPPAPTPPSAPPPVKPRPHPTTAKTK